MTTTLSEGVKVPDVGSVNWAGDLEVNWNLLNGALANLSGNVKLDRDNTWTGEQSFTLPIVGSITGTAAKAIADEDGTSIKTGYVNVAGNQTVSGNKEFTGSNTFNNILPNATNTYSLGSSSYQWSSVYAQSYYYNGTAWGLDKANTWSALNSYNQSIQITANFNIGAVPSSEVSGGFNFGNGTSNIGNITARVNSNGATYSRLYISNKFANGALDPNGTWKSVELQVGLRANGDRFIYTDGEWRNNLSPYNEANVSLGTSTNKWKTLNGVNPGALSLPSSSYVEIDTTNWDLTGADNSYTPPADGYIFCGSSTGTDVKIFDFTTALGSTSHSSTIQPNYVYLPVRKNDNCIVGFIGSAPPVARFYPCLGNV